MAADTAAVLKDRTAAMTLFTRLARALIAYSVHEHQDGHVRQIDLWLHPRSIVVQDDGRGMGLDRPNYVDDLMGLLACKSNVVQLHGVGLSLIATSTPSMRIESRRKGSLWMQSFKWGVAEAAPHQAGSAAGTGTRVELDVAPDEADIDVAEVIAQIDHWRLANPELVFIVH
jgi:DNA gyrase/topoisomerase IV subunit B